MRAKTLTMDKNEVRLFFSINYVSKKHFISRKKLFDFHVNESHHVGRVTELRKLETE